MPKKKYTSTLLSIVLFCLSSGAANSGTGFDSYAFLISPKKIIPGDTFRVLVAADESLTEATIEAEGTSGSLVVLNRCQGGGPPYWLSAEFRAEKEGSCKIWIGHEKSPLVEKTVSIGKETQIDVSTSFIWSSRQSWTHPLENLYAAWIERLFQEKGEGFSWDYLHHVLRVEGNNILYDHLGLNEDVDLILDPDCADLPFFFRAYFAWKLELPYGHHVCDRGTAQRAPQCDRWSSNHVPRREGKGDVEAFQSFARTIKNIIHSGSARAGFSDNDTDLYPLPLRREKLCPGTVFADPFGHTLMIVRWIPQTEEKSGQMLAVDAQPDGTIGIRRFWEGQFLFSTERVIGEPGFKAFRPIRLHNGQLWPLSNQEIADSPEYGNYSLQQQKLDPQVFYDTMGRLINPRPLDPIRAFRELHDAVQERLLARVKAVANGEKYMLETDFEVIPMPSGARIFQTSGPWEDYSTPARDMRLLIALDVLTDFPDKVMRNPGAFATPESIERENLKIELENLHRKWAEQITITYTRSNGEPQELTLADVLNRREKLEMAYNPNDGVELRWGAAEGSEEIASCERRAPADQHQRMESYRRWFKDRLFPIR
jgi:hypothetical protein